MKKIILIACAVVIIGSIAYLSKPVSPTVETVTKVISNAQLEEKTATP